MKNKGFCPMIMLCAALLLETTASASDRYKVLHSFLDLPAARPCSTLVSDSAGNFYGTTCVDDSVVRAGAVYELSPSSSGGWSYHVLHAFTGADGDSPSGRLLLDTAGNLYGTTYQGGAKSDGNVYELTPTLGGRWKMKTLHTFSGRDGWGSEGGLAMDTQGNLYGGTCNGGAYDQGVVYRLTPGSNGKWTDTVLHTFTNADGCVKTGLLFDTAGNLYGATVSEVFVLTRNSGGGWTESVAYTFKSADGNNPFGDLMFDGKGNLYGTNQAGGINGGGTAFKLTPNSSSGWTSTVLASFPTNRHDGYYPCAGLALDSNGNVYGTTTAGGTYDRGVVFKLAAGTDGSWRESVLHTFTGSRDGGDPGGGVTLDTSSNLYGLAAVGGQPNCGNGVGCGVVFEIIP